MPCKHNVHCNKTRRITPPPLAWDGGEAECCGYASNSIRCKSILLPSPLGEGLGVRLVVGWCVTYGVRPFVGWCVTYGVRLVVGRHCRVRCSH